MGLTVPLVLVCAVMGKAPPPKALPPPPPPPVVADAEPALPIPSPQQKAAPVSQPQLTPQTSAPPSQPAETLSAPAPAVEPLSPSRPIPGTQPERTSRQLLGWHRNIPQILTTVEVVTGGVAGGIIGAKLSGGAVRETILGVLLGAPTMYLASMAYLSVLPKSALDSALLALATGALAGAGAAVRGSWDGGTGVLSAAAGAHVGLLAVMLASVMAGEVSEEDTALVRMLSLNVGIGTGLTLWMLSSGGSSVDGTVILFAPALGMAAGGLLAMVTEVPAHRSDFLAGVPALSALTLGGLTYFLMSDGFRKPSGDVGPVPAIVATSAFGAMCVVGFLIDTRSSEERALDEQKREKQQVVVGPLLLPAGRRGEGLAVGPQVALRF